MEINTTCNSVDDLRKKANEMKCLLDNAFLAFCVRHSVSYSMFCSKDVDEKTRDISECDEHNSQIAKQSENIEYHNKCFHRITTNNKIMTMINNFREVSFLDEIDDGESDKQDTTERTNIHGSGENRENDADERMVLNSAIKSLRDVIRKRK